MITFSTCITIFAGVVVFLLAAALLFRPKATLLVFVGMALMWLLFAASFALDHIGDNANRTFEAVATKIAAQQGS